ncbi:unnamed protein product [Acanthoscelides obtectus]|uniref:Uncharacterized protein n=1 Tax=Acanthoscelides obtectus TaxID=200917 RepID=A0A9P0QFW8_ACAOB|nr:unnamed protein product [Acanthoscelides obtectus]CAK1642535.1 hypothetical protein AOBTE_LOCUS13102 [Acanthoscelides obtectus]
MSVELDFIGSLREIANNDAATAIGDSMFSEKYFYWTGSFCPRTSYEMEQSRINAEEIPFDCESLASNREHQESHTETTIRSNLLIYSSTDSEDDLPLSTIARRLQLAASASPVGRRSPVWSNVETPTPPPDFTAHSGLADCVASMTDPTPYKFIEGILKQTCMLYKRAMVHIKKLNVNIRSIQSFGYYLYPQIAFYM